MIVDLVVLLLLASYFSSLIGGDNALVLKKFGDV